MILQAISAILEKANSSIRGKVEDHRGLRLAANIVVFKDLMRLLMLMEEMVEKPDRNLVKQAFRDLMRNFHPTKVLYHQLRSQV